MHKTGDLKREAAFTDNRHSSLPAKITTKPTSIQPSNQMHKYPTSGYMVDRVGQLFHQNLPVGPLEKLKEFEQRLLEESASGNTNFVRKQEKKSVMV